MDLKHIYHLSLSERKSLLERTLKLQEELGELAEQVLIASCASGTEHKLHPSHGIQEEAVDLILVALSVFFSQGGTIEQLETLIQTKCVKWERLKT